MMFIKKWLRGVINSTAGVMFFMIIFLKNEKYIFASNGWYNKEFYSGVSRVILVPSAHNSHKAG